MEVLTPPHSPSSRALLIDGNVHGVVDLTDPATLRLSYQARLGDLLMLLLPPQEVVVVHLGGGAFAIPRALAARRRQQGQPAPQQIVVERSGAIIRLATELLGLPRDGGDLKVRKGDARAQLGRLGSGVVDMVVGDVFVGLATPRHLLTVEFVEEVARVLRPGGRYVLNLVDEPPFALLGAQVATLGSIFAEVDAVADRGVARLRDPGNVFVVASSMPIERAVVEPRLAVGGHPSTFVARGRLAALARPERIRHDVDARGEPRDLA